MIQNAFFKLPRLFMPAPLEQDRRIPLDADQAHYFHTVLRRHSGDQVRIFNGVDGEWVCQLADLGKKAGNLVAQHQIRPQPDKGRDVHLYFAPIKKSRLDWLIEKAVELGATHLHPVITQNTEVRDLNLKRLSLQIQEAAEQSERLDRPVILDPVKLHDLPRNDPLLACVERVDAIPLGQALPDQGAINILIGPEGGFSQDEIHWIKSRESWVPVTLGTGILRTETAVCAALSAILLLSGTR